MHDVLALITYSFIVEEDSGWVYSGTWGSGIWQSKDFGVTWTQLHPQVLTGFIASIARVPNSRTLYAAGGLGTDYSPGRIYKSFDLGENWFLTSNATTDSSDLSGGLLVSSLDTNYVHVGAKGHAVSFLKGGFYFTRDTGQNWQLYHLGLSQYPLSQWDIWSLAQTPNGMNILMSVRSPVNSLYRLSQVLLTPIERQPPSSFPLKLSLAQNYPNPFNAQTRIEFSLARREFITLDVYSVTGESIVNLVNRWINAGKHSMTWNGKNSKGGDVASGIYLIRLKAEKQILIRKMLLIR